MKRITLLTAIFCSCFFFYSCRNTKEENKKDEKLRLIEMSRKLLIKGKYEEAYIFLDSAIALGAKSCGIYNNMGVICKNLRKNTESYRYFKNALSIAKSKRDSSGVYNNLLGNLIDLEKYDEAFKNVSDFVKVRGDTVVGLVFESQIYSEQGKYEKAIEVLIKAEKKSASSPDYDRLWLYSTLAGTYLELRDTTNFCLNIKKASEFGDADIPAFCE
jgi:tetratricopeptide (TPR) repeat protein